VDSDNTTPVSSNVLSLTVNKADTTTAITSDTPDPSQVNAAVTVNYTVTGAYGNSPTAPTGNVTVTDGVDSCIGTAAAGTCNITLTTTGARTLTATYAGDANFNGSTSTGVAHTVNQPLTITSANNASFRVGSAGTFTVTTISSVTPSLSVSGTLPAGVGFTDNANGTATLTGTPAAGSTGTYNLVITANNGVNPNATQNFTLTVTQAPGITSANATSFSVGSAGSFTVTTSGYPTGASMLITETGSLPAGVTFVDNGNGTATLSGTPTAGSAGTYPLTIKSSNGVSPEATQSFSLGVNRVATTTSLTSDLPDPSVTGQSVTFSYAVNSASGTPTGNVTVSDGTNNCTGTVAAGSCDITFTNPGTANFTGTYAGDGTFIGSTSTTLSHTNNKANTVTDIASDTPDPSIVGEAVTVSYSVTVTAPGTGTPTGNVTVTDGTDSCTASVAAGSCTIAFSSKGTKSLQATYAGDTGFNTSTSSSQSHTVNMASTTTAITSDSPDPSVAGNSLAVNYSVTVASPGGGTPTGNVTVSDGVNSCTGTPAAGTCNLTLSTIGNRSLTATYAGDGNYANSMSSIEPHIVQGPPGVSLINSVADTGDGQVVENEHTSAAITALRVVFNKDINADTPADLNDALNLANYRLARSGNPDITIISAAYSNNGGAGPYIIDLGLIGGTALVDGHYTLTVNGRIEDTLGAPIGPDFVRNFFTDTQPIQIGTNGVILPNGTVIVDGSTLNASISEIRVAFNEDASNPANNTDPKDVTNPDNYLLIRPGPNAAFDTVSCNAGLAGDDIQVPTGPVVYSNGSGSGPYVARVTVNNGTPLGIGWYRLLVCGTTSITDLAGNVLNSGADSQLSFLVSSRSASGRGSGSSSDSEYKNPATGFAPVVTTTVPPQPADSQYSDLGDLWIELPTRGIQTSITGVPLQSNSWDLTWLDHQVGWLEGTAFPTWEGNTVLTAHNYAPDGTAGPFAGIKELKYDAPIIIHNHGMVYTYGVRMNSTVEANNSYWLNKHEDLDWVTLITCEQYDEHTHSYRYRQVVRAVLIKVEKEG
jgi:LPXTG-site transpeptidase (sortase) family protein